MSNGIMGAASAAPAVLNGDTSLVEVDREELVAVKAIQFVRDLAEAEALLGKVASIAEAVRLSKIAGDRERRWQALKLKAEARYGELLPPKEQGKRTDQLPSGGRKSNADEVAQRKARKLAEAKQADPDAFADYVDNDPKPTRAGVLKLIDPNPTTTPKPKVKRKRRKSGEATFDAGTALAYDDEVLRWVRARVRRGTTREEMMAASKAGTDGWPRPGRTLSSERDIGEIRIAIYYTELAEHLAHDAKLRKAKTPEARMRALRAMSPPTSEALFKLSGHISELVYLLDSIDVERYDLDDLAVHSLLRLHEDLMYLGEWWSGSLRAVQARLDEVPTVEKIAKLREVTVANGATPGEQANAEAFIARLQRGLDNKLGV